MQLLIHAEKNVDTFEYKGSGWHILVSESLDIIGSGNV